MWNEPIRRKVMWSNYRGEEHGRRLPGAAFLMSGRWNLVMTLQPSPRSAWMEKPAGTLGLVFHHAAERQGQNLQPDAPVAQLDRAGAF